MEQWPTVNIETGLERNIVGYKGILSADKTNCSPLDDQKLPSNGYFEIKSRLTVSRKWVSLNEFVRAHHFFTERQQNQGETDLPDRKHSWLLVFRRGHTVVLVWEQRRDAFVVLDSCVVAEASQVPNQSRTVVPSFLVVVV